MQDLEYIIQKKILNRDFASRRKLTDNLIFQLLKNSDYCLVFVIEKFNIIKKIFATELNSIDLYEHDRICYNYSLDPDNVIRFFYYKLKSGESKLMTYDNDLLNLKDILLSNSNYVNKWYKQLINDVMPLLDNYKHINEKYFCITI